MSTSAPLVGSRFVAYYRVSTNGQDCSDLSLDAQRDAVKRYAAGIGGIVVAAFEEVESGRRSDCSQLALALAECRLRCCMLLIAKIDGMACDDHCLPGLKEAGVEFIAADMPDANRLTIGVMASATEEEARITSVRTKVALATEKAGGIKPANPNQCRDAAAGAAHARATWSAMADAHSMEVALYITAARQAGATTFSQLAAALTARGVRTPRGHEKWSPWQIRRALNRVAKQVALVHGPSD